MFSQEKVQRILGKDKKELFRPIADTVRDAIADIEARGWSAKEVVAAAGLLHDKTA